MSASLLLVGSLMPALNGLRAAADLTAASADADGIVAQLNSLRPGVTSLLKLPSLPDGTSVSLGGHSILVTVQGRAFLRNCVWNLPDVTLSPGVSYTVALLGTRVEVLQTV